VSPFGTGDESVVPMNGLMKTWADASRAANTSRTATVTTISRFTRESPYEIRMSSNGLVREAGLDSVAQRFS
jgi:hypothetical protein